MRTWRCSVVVVTVVLASWVGAGTVRREPATAVIATGSTSTALTASTTTSTTVATTTTAAPTITTAVAAPPPVTGAPSGPPVGPEGHATVLDRGDGSQAVVALTFDGGADVGYTAQILDTLTANGIAASFGITGEFAQQNADVVRRMAHEGHQVINHTYDHSSFTGRSTGHAPLTSDQRRAQLDEADAAISAVTGVTTKPWFRPPYGDYDTSVNADAFAVGYTYNVMWTVDSLGWRGLSTQQIVDCCLARAQAGAIYLFHVGSVSQDAAALQGIIDGLRAGGYGFVTVAALLY